MNFKLIRLGASAGLIGSTFPLALVWTSTFLEKTFSWSRDPLSDIGVSSYGWLFNSAVLLSGLLGLIFVIGLLKYLGKTHLALVGTALFGLGNLGLALVGVFTEHSGMTHAFVALMYFLLTPLGAVCLGLTKKDHRFVRIGLPIGVAALLAIIGLPIAFSALNLQVGFSVPEFLESFVLSIWVFVLSLRMIK
jgi:hypothetical membrane protein